MVLLKDPVHLLKRLRTGLFRTTYWDAIQKVVSFANPEDATLKLLPKVKPAYIDENMSPWFSMRVFPAARILSESLADVIDSHPNNLEVIITRNEYK